MVIGHEVQRVGHGDMTWSGNTIDKSKSIVPCGKVYCQFTNVLIIGMNQYVICWNGKKIYSY